MAEFRFMEPRECFDRCCIGWAQRMQDAEPVAVYDYELCVRAWMEWQGGIPEHEARRWLDREAGSWTAPAAPQLLLRGRTADLEDFLATREA